MEVTCSALSAEIRGHDWFLENHPAFFRFFTTDEQLRTSHARIRRLSIAQLIDHAD